ncbi:MAG: CHAT domain-containing protein, partial [Okeania sp. SIO2D1]|nr:CHAT domain-containing protein [Okeania sp. SIO2D1]
AKPAIIYGMFVPGCELVDSKSLQQEESSPRDGDCLELVLVTTKGEIVRRQVPGTNRREVLEQVSNFRRAVTNYSRPRAYRSPAKQFYQWLVSPLEEQLRLRGIDNLVYILDEGLRSIPLAAMHDGEKFVIETYSIGLMPSLSLTDTRHAPLRDLKVLAMGASSFQDKRVSPLPGVPAELSLITEQLWSGKAYLNEAFTLNRVKQARDKIPFGIIHLATHGEFNAGEPANSFIQLWNDKLALDQLRTLGWHNPPVELLILSACRTALGNREAELGFAGLAVAAGVKSALGSLWTVSDEGTLALMTNFYQHLPTAPIKTEALRQAQLSMMRGEVKLDEGNLVTPQGTIVLPNELADLGSVPLTHPYYWSGFTMIGNPW